MNEISVQCAGELALPYNEVTEYFIELLTSRILGFLNAKDDSIDIILCSDKEIRQINRKYRNKDYATDVISFAYDEEPFPGEENASHRGDIFLSLERALAQSEEYSVTFPNEVKRLLVHSILHLYGYDHERGEENARLMYNKEDAFLALLADEKL